MKSEIFSNLSSDVIVLAVNDPGFHLLLSLHADAIKIAQVGQLVEHLFAVVR